MQNHRFVLVRDPELRKQIRDLAWDQAQVNAHANPKRLSHEIRSWSAWLETMPIGDAEDLEWFGAQAKRLNPARTDLHTVMDYLDADDHVSLGGQA